MSSVNFNKEASVNTPDMIQTLAREMLRRGILPELEAFDAGMINYAKYLEVFHSPVSNLEQACHLINRFATYHEFVRASA